MSQVRAQVPWHKLAALQNCAQMRMLKFSKAETDVGPRRRLSEGTATYDVYVLGSALMLLR
jgi:hypothetical protein